MMSRKTIENLAGIVQAHAHDATGMVDAMMSQRIPSELRTCLNQVRCELQRQQDEVLDEIVIGLLREGRVTREEVYLEMGEEAATLRDSFGRLLQRGLIAEEDGVIKL